MKVTFVLPGWARYPIGGYKMVYSYANFLAEKGHQVRIVHTLRLYREGMNLVKKAFRWVYWSGSSLFRKTRPKWFELSPRAESLLVLDLKGKHVLSGDAVIATAWSTAESVSKLSSDKGTKFYLIQGYETWDSAREKVDATFRLPLMKIVVSTWLKEMIGGKGEEVIACIPNGLDLEMFRIIRSVEERFFARVGMCYSVYEWKGSKEGIEALSMVKEKLPQLQVVFFSVCSRNSEIPSWIEYRRNPSLSQLVDIYNSCSIFIDPSWSEGWGLPAAEAMACGCAVVSARNRGTDEFIIDRETGLLSKIKDPNDLAEKVIKLIEDRPLRLTLAQKGGNYIRKFDLKKSAEEFEETILSNLGNK